MKQQRLRVKVLALVMFGLFLLLAVYGGYSVMKYGNRWFTSRSNQRLAAQRKNVIAGDILDRNGVVLAHTNEDGERVYQEDEAARTAIVHLVGDGDGNVANAVEVFQTRYLYGFEQSFPELLAGLFSGEPRRGDNVRLTVSAELTTHAWQAFDKHEATRNKRGAVVVMNWRTGEILALLSRMGFDPMNVPAGDATTGSPFMNRATQSVLPPGSTFKVVTAAAGLEHVAGAEEITYECSTDVLDFGENIISDYQGGRHGTVTLRTAFMKSCNKMFASVAASAGHGNMLRTAESFGFNDNFLFRDLVVENSAYPKGSVTEYELAASGFGQGAVAATPLHMCMVAAAVANDGVMMEPRLLREVTTQKGNTRLSFSTAVYRRAMPAQTAAVLQGYMRDAVTGGTGGQAAVRGLTVCGKTGTSDSTDNGAPVSYGWFIGYAADPETPYALCVMVEDIGDTASGGSTAAPVAADIFTWLRDHPDLVGE